MLYFIYSRWEEREFRKKICSDRRRVQELSVELQQIPFYRVVARKDSWI